jgi:hypothetical protein
VDTSILDSALTQLAGSIERYTDKSNRSMLFRPRGARHEVIRDLEGTLAVYVRPIMGVVPSVILLLVLFGISTAVKLAWLKYSMEDAITVAVSMAEGGPEAPTSSTFIAQSLSEDLNLHGSEPSQDADDDIKTNE